MLGKLSKRIAVSIASAVLAISIAPGLAMAADADAGGARSLNAGTPADGFAQVSTQAEGVAAGSAAKAANPMKASAKSSRITLRYSLVKKSSQTIAKSKAFSISKAKGKVTFKKKSGNAKIAVSKNGTITVKKGLKAGTYTVKVKVRAAGTSKYKAVTKLVTIKIRLRGDIKGNISYTTGERIYHVPGDRYYSNTIIDESEGERWFVTEAQARKAGWRHSYV